MNAPELDPALAARIAHLRFRPRTIGEIEGRGERSSRVGRGFEFADYRPYQRGDDPRTIDWAVFARMERLVTRRFRKELEAPVILALDASSSMTLGFPSKVNFSASAALAMAWIGFSGGHRVGAACFSTSVDGLVEPRRERSHLGVIREFFAQDSTGGTTDFGASLARLAERFPGPALAIVLSDLMGPGLGAGLAALRRRRIEVVVVHVLARIDEDPGQLAEEVEIEDVETGASLRLAPQKFDRSSYRRAFDRWARSLSAQVLSCPARYVRTSSDRCVSTFVTHDLLQAGIVGRRGQAA